MGALGGVTRDWLFYRAAGGHGADRHRFVFAGNFTRLQRFHQPGLRRHGFRHHHQSGGVFIQTVHNAGTRHVGDFRVMMQQRIEHRAVRVTGARVHHQIARLVDHQDVAVFIDDIQRDILRLPTRLFFNLCIDGDGLSAQHLLFRFV